MKIYKKRIITLILIILSIFQIFMLFPSFVSAQDDIIYIFNNEVLYDDTNLNFDTEYNVRNAETFTGVYNATYSFTNESVGTSFLDIDFIDNGFLGTNTIKIILDFDNHNKVINITHSGGAGDPNMINNFASSQVSDNIEFWMATTDKTKQTEIRIREVNTQSLVFAIRSGNYQVLDGVGWQDSGVSVVDDKFDHHRIEFDCTTDTYDWYLNGILIVNDADFRNVATSLDNVQIACTTNTVFSSFFDGIDYSWENGYSDNRNLIPLIYTDTSIIQKDKYEFDFFNQSNIYQDGYDNNSYSGWNKFEYDAHGGVIINYDGDDIGIEITAHGVDTGEEWGIEKEFSLTENIYNVSWKWKITESGGLASNYSTSIYNSDDTLIVSFFFIFIFSSPLTITIGYNNWLGQTVLLSLAPLDYDVYIDCNLYINYNDDIGVFKWSKGGIFNDSYIIPIESGTNGISKIKKIMRSAPLIAGNNNIQLDSIGIYENGLSISNDFAYLNLEIGLFPVIWFYDRQNIFKIQMEGTYEIHPTVQEFNPTALGFSDLIPFNNITSYTSSLEIYNIYDYYYGSVLPLIGISSPWLTFHINGNTSLINSLQIIGSSLNSEGNKYWQFFEHDNIDTNINYFSVDSNNKLLYTHTSDNSLLEYMQITFNITEVSSFKAFISFTSFKTGNAFGNFIVGFNDDTSNVIEFTNVKTDYRVLLSQNKTISQFKILISDNNNSNSDFTSGNIYNIKIRFVVSEVSITILTLIGMMIPLIIILTPSLAISSTYGKNLIVPLFILMSVICLVGNIIPTWLFFIIGFSVISFMFINKDDLREVV